jgi:hypothetical protein
MTAVYCGLFIAGKSIVGADEVTGSFFVNRRTT